MLLKFGTEVLTNDDKKIGSLESVIVDPATQEITYLVVRKGVLTTEDKMVPISLVAQSDRKRIKLYEFEGSVDDLPLYEKTMFVPLEDYIDEDLEGKVIPLVFYPPLSSPRTYNSHLTAMPLIKKELPADKDSIPEGADVYGLEGKKIGQVREVILDPETDRVTHLLVKAGLLFKHDFLIPAEWVRSISDSRLELYVNERLIQNLPSYEARGVPKA